MTNLQKLGYVALAMLLCGIGGTIYGVHWQKVRDAAAATKTLQENEKLKESERAAVVQAGQFEQTAEDATARGLDAKAEKDAASAEVARLKSRLASIKMSTSSASADALPDVSVVGPMSGGLSDSVVSIQSELIAAQDVRYEAQGKQLVATEQARDAYKSESVQLKVALKVADDRAAILEAQIRSMAKPRPWAAGAVYGSDGMAGGSVERDLGPLRVGVDVVRHKLPGGDSKLEAVGRVYVRF